MQGLGDDLELEPERRLLSFRRVPSREGGAAGGADLDRQRRVLRPRRAGVDGRPRKPLPGDLPPWGHEPRDDDDGRRAGPQRLNWSTYPIGSCSSCGSKGRSRSGLDAVELLDYHHLYSVADAVLTRRLRFRDRAGRTTSLLRRRFASMARRHQAGLEWTLLAEDWSGSVQLISALDGRVTNRGVARYQELEGAAPGPGADPAVGAGT